MAAGAVPATVSEQQAQVVDFQKVGPFRRIVARQNLLRVLKKGLAGDMDAEHLLLHGLARPVREQGAARVEDGLIEQGDGGESRQLDILHGVAGALRLRAG